jgi:predicted DNA-binding protein
MEDYVKLYNNSSDSNIKFTVYVHHPDRNKWLVYGVGILKGYGDTDTIDAVIDDIEDYRYFAIESLNDKDYEYQIYKRRNDLYITILDK